MYRRALVPRIKIMSDLDISERWKPQDGKIRFTLNQDREVELRVATWPIAGNNEDIGGCSRRKSLSLDTMEFAPATITTLQEITEKPHGISWCVGLTGSGKMTTWHSLRRHLNIEERKI